MLAQFIRIIYFYTPAVTFTGLSLDDDVGLTYWEQAVMVELTRTTWLCARRHCCRLTPTYKNKASSTHVCLAVQGAGVTILSNTGLSTLPRSTGGCGAKAVRRRRGRYHGAV